MNNPKSPPFEIGLCMAGAVSAGAYTAGVMDYLLEALEEWEKRKILDPKNTPMHEVVIPVMGGASAGGMTCIITANAIQNEIVPIRNVEDIPTNSPKNKLFNAWVNLTNEDMFPELLKNDDLKDGVVESLFNAHFIDEIAQKTLQPNSNLSPANRKYFAEDLKVFTTLTNLNGIQFKQEFMSDSDQSSYHISKHSDFACFQINAQQYEGKGWIPLNFSNPDERQLAMDAAMATGAFPIGLKARKVIRPTQYVKDCIFHDDVDMKVEDEYFETLNIDGGTINNEPYEKVQKVLAQNKPLEKSYSKATSTVLMIDPFPSEEPIEKKFGDQIGNVISGTIGAMLNHLRFEPKSISDSNDPDDASVYLVAPVRYEKKADGSTKKIEGKEAIACGFLSGFGGFIHRDFRLHDYFLGRANCERFLRQYFTIPIEAENPIINKGYEHLPTDAFVVTNNSSGRKEYPIIPLFDEQDDLYLPDFDGQDWPQKNLSEIHRFRRPLKKRFGKIIMNIMKLKWYVKGLLWIGNHLVLKKMASKKFIEIMEKEMKDWDLIRK
ncbi:MAG: patatin-like phospholipase family protein [Crocinitomicaceae bacterium]